MQIMALPRVMWPVIDVMCADKHECVPLLADMSGSSGVSQKFS